MTLPPEGYQSRFSDSLNRVDVTFIPLVNAEVSSLMGGDVEKSAFYGRLQVPCPGGLSGRRRSAAARLTGLPGRGVPRPASASTLGVRAEVEEEGEHDDEPLEAVDAVGRRCSTSPCRRASSRAAGRSRARDQPAVEGAAEHVAEEPDANSARRGEIRAKRVRKQPMAPRYPLVPYCAALLRSLVGRVMERKNPGR